jgi:putative peptide zinc metalloprotease protein
MLLDPAANRFYQLAWPAFELLSRWWIDDPEEIVAAVNRETTLRVSLDDLGALLRMLRQQNLVVASSADDTARLTAAAEAGRMSHAMWLLKHYLLIRIPVWRPGPFLDRFARYVAFAYRPAFWWLVAGCAALGLALLSRRWDAFVHTFRGYAGVQGFVAIGLTLFIAKALHEFGHAFTAHRYGCRVPTMGIAILVMAPMLYTDTTDAWKVPNRLDRLRIGAAGILSEIALAAFATLAWNLLPDGPLQAGAFLLATTTWVATIAINASPFMRFDGYFLLSDWLDMPNLHDRAFALARWWAREALFGFGDPQPEPFTPGRRRFLIAFSFVTWLYRLIVFFSIALIVYHTFFKALGVILFCVEFGWFLVRPIAREIAVYWRRRRELHWRYETARTALVASALLAVLVLPWRGGVDAPAVFGAAEAQGVYAPAAGHIADEPAPPRIGQAVHAGDVLTVLVSPDLGNQLKKAQADEGLLQWEVAQQAFDDRLREQGTALAKRLEAAKQAVAGLNAQIARLTIRAPFDGVIKDVDEGLAPGTWLPRGEKLFDVVGPAGIKGDGYVGEEDIARTKPGDAVTFVASRSGMAALHCRVAAVDRVNMTTIDEPSVASVYGGGVPAKRQADGRQIVPLRATYRVRIDQCDGAQGLAQQVTGVAVIGAAHESIAWRGVRRLIAVLEREAG